MTELIAFTVGDFLTVPLCKKHLDQLVGDFVYSLDDTEIGNMSYFLVLLLACFILNAKSEKFVRKIPIDAVSWANGIPTTVDNIQ